MRTIQGHKVEIVAVGIASRCKLILHITLQADPKCSRHAIVQHGTALIGNKLAEAIAIGCYHGPLYPAVDFTLARGRRGVYRLHDLGFGSRVERTDGQRTSNEDALEKLRIHCRLPVFCPRGLRTWFVS